MKLGLLSNGERLCALAMLIAAAFIWWAHGSLDRDPAPFGDELHVGGGR